MPIKEIELVLKLEEDLLTYERLVRRNAEINKNERQGDFRSSASSEQPIEELRKINIGSREDIDRLHKKLSETKLRIINNIRKITTAMSPEDKNELTRRIYEEESKKISKNDINKKTKELINQQKEQGQDSKISKKRGEIKVQMPGAADDMVDKTLNTWLEGVARKRLSRNAVKSRIAFLFGSTAQVQESLEMSSPTASSQTSESPVSEAAVTPKVTAKPPATTSEKGFISTNSNTFSKTGSIPSSFKTKKSGITSLPTPFAAITRQKEKSRANTVSSFESKTSMSSFSLPPKKEKSSTLNQKNQHTPKEVEAPIKYQLENINSLTDLMSKSSTSTSRPTCLAKKGFIYIQLGINKQDQSLYAIMGPDSKLIQNELPPYLAEKFRVFGGNQALINEIITITPELNLDSKVDTSNWDEAEFAEPVVNTGATPKIPENAQEILNNSSVHGFFHGKKISPFQSPLQPQQKTEQKQEQKQEQPVQTSSFMPATPRHLNKESMTLKVVTGSHKQQLQKLKAEQEQEQISEKDKDSPGSPR